MVGGAHFEQLFASPVGACGDAFGVVREVVGKIGGKAVGPKIGFIVVVSADHSSQHDGYPFLMAISPQPEPPTVVAIHPPTVVAIHIALASRMDMRAVDQVEAEAGEGLVGDRYHGSRHRHITVQSATDLDEASEIFGQPLDPGLTRRNITVSHGDIPTTPGDRYAIGDVQLEVVRIAAPCKLLEDQLGAGAKTALRRRAGTVFRCLTSGTIAIGTTVSQ